MRDFRGSALPFGDDGCGSAGVWLMRWEDIANMMKGHKRRDAELVI